MSARIVTVVGATGNQGSGVVTSLLTSTSFDVRALVRDLSSCKATNLLEKHSEAARSGRLTLVQGSLGDKESLEKALEGSEGVFAGWGHFGGEEDAEEIEFNQGKNLVDAAKAANVKHFVYSTLPSMAQASEGKFTHAASWESKYRIGKYAQEQLEGVTLVIPAFFYGNLDRFATRIGPGVVKFSNPALPTAVFQWCDERCDIGVFVAAILNKGPALTAGKTYPIATSDITLDELVKEYHLISGEQASFETVPLETAVEFAAQAMGGGEVVKKRYTEQFSFYSYLPAGKSAYGTLHADADKSHEDLGVKASSFKEWMERTGWRVGSGKA